MKVRKFHGLSRSHGSFERELRDERRKRRNTNLQQLRNIQTDQISDEMTFKEEIKDIDDYLSFEVLEVEELTHRIAILKQHISLLNLLDETKENIVLKLCDVFVFYFDSYSTFFEDLFSEILWTLTNLIYVSSNISQILFQYRVSDEISFIELLLRLIDSRPTKAQCPTYFILHLLGNFARQRQEYRDLILEYPILLENVFSLIDCSFLGIVKHLAYFLGSLLFFAIDYDSISTVIEVLLICFRHSDLQIQEITIEAMVKFIDCSIVDFSKAIAKFESEDEEDEEEEDEEAENFLFSDTDSNSPNSPNFPSKNCYAIDILLERDFLSILVKRIHGLHKLANEKPKINILNLASNIVAYSSKASQLLIKQRVLPALQLLLFTARLELVLPTLEFLGELVSTCSNDNLLEFFQCDGLLQQIRCLSIKHVNDVRIQKECGYIFGKFFLSNDFYVILALLASDFLDIILDRLPLENDPSLLTLYFSAIFNVLRVYEQNYEVASNYLGFEDNNPKFMIGYLGENQSFLNALEKHVSGEVFNIDELIEVCEQIFELLR
eukprot:TRINITY_DN2955_c1_g1_i1.p1 TRINITY_DN2955_c1_g1~~TRINITY_DN2955_c1_g1_i1.p1  ORF type:complete len:552 (-),score=122.26 TRINITY_DN2955_c1_g1_i1:105-1760(-)